MAGNYMWDQHSSRQKYFVGLLTGMGLVITARFYFKNSFLNGNILSTLVIFSISRIL